ncbi:hypothetical protein Aph01nite_33410 [Acrocarpospora phusangensis]|uniref:Uncharacterized protein n=1 Tax=Acrocarpospora phusangensis TaxID=1070424 RepID=A0A919QA47_9ACTN|nr:hypothetical protein [Acrocarpospora phusangensis]GIH25031.1 hypothetical protein Aph01nite_33410 [Acrocarpospora phusangensis]
MIDLAVGLLAVYVVFSLLINGIVEGIVKFRGLRGRFLWEHLRDELDPQRPAGSPAKLWRWLAGLPLVGSMAGHSFREILDPYRPRAARSTMRFARQLVMGGKDHRPFFEQAGSPAMEEPVALADLLHQRLRAIDDPERGGRSGIKRISPNLFARAMAEIVEELGGAEQAVVRLRAGGNPFSRSLHLIRQKAGDDVEKLHQAMEEWFTIQDQFVSGLFRRHLLRVIMVVAFGLTCLFAVDTLAYVQDIVNDNALRAHLASDGGIDDAAVPSMMPCPPGGPADVCVAMELGRPALIEVFAHSPVRLTFPPYGPPTLVLDVEGWWDRLTDSNHWLGYGVTFVALAIGSSFWWNVVLSIVGMRPRR